MVAVGPVAISAGHARNHAADDTEAVLDINRQAEQLVVALDDLRGHLNPLLNLAALGLFIAKAGRLLGSTPPPARTQSSQLQVGPLRIDLRSSDVTVAEERLHLSRREHDLLSFLMRHPDEALTRERILREVWGESQRGKENLLDVYIGYVRTKLRPHGVDGMLETLRGTGYILRSTLGGGGRARVSLRLCRFCIPAAQGLR
jgi:DNA-binding winged helix-turn-helix (wHTH) protein